jgi:transcriptional regulator with XRE-family HTH domain
MSSIQDMLRRLRELGLTQVEIARRTGVPQPRLSRWESGAVPSGADDALKVLELYLKVGDEATAKALAAESVTSAGLTEADLDMQIAAKAAHAE